MRNGLKVLFVVVGLWVVFLQPVAVNGAESAGGASYDTPVARYGDMEMSLGYYFFYSRVSNDKLRMVNRMEGKDRENLIKNVLNDVFFEHQVMKDAEKNGFLKDAEYTTHIRDLENDWLTRLYEYHNFFKNYKPNDEDLKKLYEEKKEEYFQKEQFSFRHIFLQTVDRTEEQQKQARARADEALALIKAGSDFVEIAKKYSDSERKGNVIGPMTPSKYNPDKPLNPVLEKALLSMKPGTVSDVIETKYGYEILKLDTFRPESYQPLATVKDKLASELRVEDYKKWKQKNLDDNWDKLVAKFNPDVIFKDNADPKSVIFEVAGQAFDMENYDWLKGRDSEKKGDETEEQFRERRIDYLKNTLVYRYLVGKLARDLHYDEIPFYVERVKQIRNYRTFMAWYNRSMSEYLEKHPNTEDEKKEFYEENQKRFLKNQTARIGEMTFKLPAHDKDNLYEVHKAQDAAEEKAKKAIERVKNGEDFAKVAREMSESSTAKDGGDLGVISTDASPLPRMVATQAIRLGTGEVCDEPVKSEDTYYVVICYEKPEREPIPFSDPSVQKNVDSGLTNQKRGEFRDGLKERLFDESKVEILYDGLYSFNPVNLQSPSLDPPGADKSEEESEK